MRLTKRTIDAARYDRTDGRRQVLWDDELPGFGVRLNPAGSKSFVLSYRMPGSRRKQWLTVGRYGPMTLAQARAKAKRLMVQVADGQDPAETRRREEAETLATFAAHYLERWSKPRKRSWREDDRRLRVRILPALGRLRLEDIRTPDVAALHATVAEDGGKVEANRCVELLRAMLNKARAPAWGFLPGEHPNAAEHVERYPEDSRDRWVRPAEVPRLMEAIEQEPDVYVRSFFVLLMLTGCRRSELLRARWEDVDRQRRELRIPQTKNRKPHHVPLSEPALAVLDALPRELRNAHIFPGPGAAGHLVNVNKPWRKIRERAGCPDVTLHDLRRTVGSWLAMGGASLPLIGKVLGHRSTVTTQVYARLAEDAGREALEEHGRRLLEAAGGALPVSAG